MTLTKGQEKLYAEALEKYKTQKLLELYNRLQKKQERHKQEIADIEDEEKKIKELTHIPTCEGAESPFVTIGGWTVSNGTSPDYRTLTVAST